tara:strand:- start:235 stop:819 length:585 start_codon:yes stop_codon:yes gene_type:complete
MVKLFGKIKINTAVFISGRGSNLKSLINYSKKNKTKIKLTLVITDNKKAIGLKYAKQNNIKNIIINYNNKRIAEKKILQILIQKKIKLICLAGFLKILSHNFISEFKLPILNIHPSLLPKYKGLHTHKRVIKNKEKYTGCTVHLVNKKLDSGKVILQKKIRVYKIDTIQSLKSRVLKHEHLLYPKAISKFCSNL